jgi:hypothetical protein
MVSRRRLFAWSMPAGVIRTNVPGKEKSKLHQLAFFFSAGLN